MVIIPSGGPPQMQIRIRADEVGVPLKFFGTDREIGGMVFSRRGTPVGRRIVQYWRQGKKKVPDWAQVQLSNIYWRKVMLNDALVRGAPTPEMSSTAVSGYEGTLMSPIYWKRTRRDGRPMYIPGSGAIPAAKNLALSHWPGRALHTRGGAD